MTTGALLLLGIAGVFAVADWLAVGKRSKTAEYVAKPATLLALIGVAVLLEPVDDAQRIWFVGALALSLAGDVFLMLPRDAFLPGLASFLAAHVAYVAGLAIGIDSAVALVVALGLVAAAAAPVAYRIVAGAARRDRRLPAPVAAYVTVIAVMVAFALATRNPLAGAGAALFFVSDGMIGWTRFVRTLPWSPVPIMVTYHLGQALLVVSLTR